MKYISTAIGAAAMLALTVNADAAVFSVNVEGTDAIFLAGRTDLSIPAPNLSWPEGMLRHGSPTPEEAMETLPSTVAVTGGSVVRVLDPVSGGINFFNGFGPGFFGPEGNGIPGSSSITSFGGISGYLGTQGALTGVFLTDAVPSAGPVAPTLDFRTSGLGVDFLTLSPLIGQVFFIGNGVTAGGIFQQFIAPTGATRLALGVPDAFGFNGAPGAYDDNDGSYRIRVGVDEIPTVVPVPGALPLFLSGLVGLGLITRRRRKAAAA